MTMGMFLNALMPRCGNTGEGGLYRSSTEAWAARLRPLARFSSFILSISLLMCTTLSTCFLIRG